MSRIVRVAVASCLALLAGCPEELSKQSGDESGASEQERDRRDPVAPRVAEGEAIEYTLRFPEPQTHYVQVEAVFPTDGEDQVELFMAVWTPGSYLVRDYPRFLDHIEASTLDGAPLAVDKSTKNRWRVDTGGHERVVVRYRLYCHELTVRHNFVEDEFAMLNGAPTFISLVGGRARPHDVLLELPSEWQSTVTQLPEHPDGDPHRYVAASYDVLVDSPILAGNPRVYEFEVAGRPHRIAHMPDAAAWDGETSTGDVEQLVETHVDFWGDAPYDRYIFMNMLVESGGGLEHMESALIMASRWATRKRDDYVRWLGLVSHEFFHTWNVKRLRPRTLTRYDLEEEQYTRSLWIIEGITSYYDDLLLARAGLIDESEYLELLSKRIAELQTNPGREVQSLEMASFDAWIKYYRPYENSRNSTISYYTKGAVVAFLLDARIRRATSGAKSLDDLMQLAYRRFSGEGYTPQGFRALAEEVAGTSLDELFGRYVHGTDELDYRPALDYYGLRFPTGAAEGESDEGSEEPGDAWLGVRTGQEHGGRLVVKSIQRDSPAQRAGIAAGDEIIGLGGYRVPSKGLGACLERYAPGDELAVLVARRGELKRLDVVLAAEPGSESDWQLEVVAQPTGAQRARLKEWLEG